MEFDPGGALSGVGLQASTPEDHPAKLPFGSMREADQGSRPQDAASRIAAPLLSGHPWLRQRMAAWIPCFVAGSGKPSDTFPEPA
jgi:hypothetical protein